MVESERRVLVAVIDRRQRMDRWIVYLGMAIMLAFLYLLYCASHALLSMCPSTIHLPKLPRRRRREIGFLRQAFCLTSCCVVAGWKFTYRVVGGLAEEDGGAEGADAPA